MLEWLRENNKRVMAILGVFLMIAFIIPTFNNDRTGEDPRLVIAHVGDNREELRRADLAEAQIDFQILTKGMGQINLIQETIHPRLYIAIAQAYGMFGPSFAQQLAPNMTQQIIRNLDPVHYMLLLHEARRMGVRASDDLVDSYMNQLKTAGVPDNSDYRTAVRNLLTIMEAFDQVANAPKLSTAEAIHDLAGPQQQVSLQLVDFKASDFRSDVPVPTPQQLQEFFLKHRDNFPEQDPHGIGYRYPNRVKVEYLVIPRDELRKTITEEEVYKHYKDNPTQFFPVTQPVTQPATTQATTQSATQPTTLAAATTRPKEPGPQIKEQIRDILANQAAIALAKSIDQIFKSDWPTFREAAKSAGTTIPAQAPPTSLGVPFHTTEYLAELQKRVQRMKESRGVLVRLNSWQSDFMSKRDLAELPGIGQSVVNLGQQQIRFPDYAIDAAAPFIPQDQLSQAQEGQLLRMYQPSVPFRGQDNNYYIFRLIGAQPEHTASDMEPIAAKVRDDWVTMQAYEMAKQAAQKFYDAIKGKGELASATGATTRPTTRPVITTGLVSNRAQETIPDYPLPPEATENLVDGGFKLLAERLRTGNASPAGVIELPRAQTVVVAQLQEAKPAEKDANFAQELWQNSRQQFGMSTAMKLQRWFDPSSIEARAKYAPASGGEAPQPRRSAPRPPIIPGA